MKLDGGINENKLFSQKDLTYYFFTGFIVGMACMYLFMAIRWKNIKEVMKGFVTFVTWK